MNIVSKNIMKFDKARKYFKKKKDGDLRLLMTLDYFLLQRMYGCMTPSERINKILSKKGCYGLDKEILEEINETLSDDELSKAETIDAVIDLMKQL